MMRELVEARPGHAPDQQWGQLGLSTSRAA